MKFPFCFGACCVDTPSSTSHGDSPATGSDEAPEVGLIWLLPGLGLVVRGDRFARLLSPAEEASEKPRGAEAESNIKEASSDLTVEKVLHERNEDASSGG